MVSLRAIYDRSPIFLQNIFTSAYGYQLHGLRYGGEYKQHLDLIESTQWWSQEKLQKFQLEQLRKMLFHAFNHVPFYQDRFQEVGFHPNDLNSTEDLLQLPILTRQDILQNKDRMIAKNYSPSLLINYSSGTTGTPLEFYEDKYTVRRNYAFLMRFRRWFGFKEWLPRATFGGRIVVPRAQNDTPFWRYNHAEKQMVFSSFHISDATLPAYVKQLERFAPFVIDGYVSTISMLAQYLNRQGITWLRPAAVHTTSETLHDFQRREIEQAFQCKVFNQYGQGEKAAFITECEQGRLHINDEYGIVEIVKDGRHARPGETGEIIATGFNNWVMPLIRYQTSDMAIASDTSKCTCGRGLSRVETVEGRVIDILKMPDGKIVPPTALTLLFDKAAAMGICKAQIRQTAPDQIIVRLVPQPDSELPETSLLENDLRMMLGTEVKIQFEEVTDIPRTAAGKYKFVVSEVSQ